MPKPSTHTRDRLIEGARHLFWERGYGAASLADILDRADANSGSFYHFFESKESLLRAVLTTYLDGLDPAILAPARAATKDPIERIFAVLAGYRGKLVATGYTYGCPLGRLALEVDAESRPTQDLIARNFAAWRNAMRGFLRDAGDRLPRDLDLDSLATLILTVMEGGVMQARAAGGPEPFDRSVEQLRDYFRRLDAHSQRSRPRTSVSSTRARPTKTTPRRDRS